MLWLILSLAARADTFTLDNGTTLEGALAEYNLNGSCQVSITSGELVGALVVLPCERITRFERLAAAPAPAPEPLLVAPEADAALALPVEAVPPLAEPVPVTQPFAEAPFATASVEAPLALPAAEEAFFDEEAAEAEEEAAEELAAGPLWADESGAEAGGAVRAPGAPAAGGVVLPALPNLRVMRRPDTSGGPAEE